MKNTNLNLLAKKAFENAREKGFHEKPKTDAHWLMLVACELAEVAEAINTEDPCLDCSLNNGRGLICSGDTGVTGFCYAGMRSDDKQIIFKEVSKKERPLDSLLNGDFTDETSEVWN